MLRSSAAALLATAGMASAHPGHEAAVAQGALVLAEIARRGVRRLARHRAAKSDP